MRGKEGGNFSHEEKQHPFICEYRGKILDEEEEAVFIHLYSFLPLIQHQPVKTIFMLTNSFLLFLRCLRRRDGPIPFHIWTK